eukprot:GHVP01035574.1.p1 GENE.GHVP01035574.1~~GHVP01035574.1.p1  ORF type:complete len:140 (+),score=17.26 GHVP01035574.1:89-508(+)
MTQQPNLLPKKMKNIQRNCLGCKKSEKLKGDLQKYFLTCISKYCDESTRPQSFPEDTFLQIKSTVKTTDSPDDLDEQIYRLVWCCHREPIWDGKKCSGESCGRLKLKFVGNVPDEFSKLLQVFGGREIERTRRLQFYRS